MTMPTTAAPAPGATHVPVAALFADFDYEVAATRRLLERFPAEHADWTPHAQSMPLARLASHVAEMAHLATAIVERPEWNVAEHGRFQPVVARTAAELLAAFDAGVSRLRSAIAGLDATALAADWRFRNGDVVFFGGPRGDVLRRLFVSHTAHHRGQLTVYYRLLGVPVPGMYGPSSDER